MQCALWGLPKLERCCAFSNVVNTFVLLSVFQSLLRVVERFCKTTFCRDCSLYPNFVPTSFWLRLIIYTVDLTRRHEHIFGAVHTRSQWYFYPTVPVRFKLESADGPIDTCCVATSRSTRYSTCRTTVVVGLPLVYWSKWQYYHSSTILENTPCIISMDWCIVRTCMQIPILV